MFGLMNKITPSALHPVPRAQILLRDVFCECVRDLALHQELKQCVWHQPEAFIMDARGSNSMALGFLLLCYC